MENPRIPQLIAPWIAFLAGCASVVPRPEAPERDTVEVLFADRIDERDFVILRRSGSREIPVANDTDWESYLEVAPLDEPAPERVVLFGPDGRCTARVTAAVRIERMSVPSSEGEDRTRMNALLSSFDALEVDAPCEGWLAILRDGGGVEFAPAVYEREYEHGGEDAFGRFDERWRFVAHYGPPVDEICPDDPLFEILEGDRSAARVGDRGYVTLRGLLVRSGERALVLDGLFDRAIVSFDGETRESVVLPSRVPIDEGASPCL
jgi:hypothetical protein